MNSPSNQLQKSDGRLEMISRAPGGKAFKYYIHDATENCRLQLIGNFTQTHVPELSGCWRTARTTLGNRRLILDLRAVAHVDDSAKQWIAVMAQEGAICLPEDFLRTWLGRPDAPSIQKPSTWARLFAFLRGLRVPAVE